MDEKKCSNCTAWDPEEEYCPYFMTEKSEDDEACTKWTHDKWADD